MGARATAESGRGGSIVDGRRVSPVQPRSPSSLVFGCHCLVTTITPAIDVERRRRRRVAAAVVGLGATQIIGWGTLFNPLSVYAVSMGRDLAVPREVIFTGITIMLLVAAALAAPLGRLVDRIGPRWIMSAGSIVVAAALVGMSFSQGPFTYLAAWMVTGLAMPMMLSNTALPGLVQVVGPNARSAITALMLMSGLTSTIFLPYNQWLLETIGWRNAYLVFAAMHLTICLPIHALLLRRRVGIDGGGPVKPGQSSGEPMLPPEKRRRAFIMLATWSCTEGLITWGLYIQVIDVFKALGLSTTTAIAVWAFVGPCQALARFADLALGGRTPILTTSLLSALLTTCSFVFLVPFGVTFTSAVLFAVTMGLGHGLFAIARNTLPLTLFGVREYGAYMGLLMVPQNIANALAPILFAAIIARLGAVLALWVAFAAALTGCLAVTLLTRACALASPTPPAPTPPATPPSGQ
jgi:MFS family permease